MVTPVDEEKYNLKWNSHNSIMANTVLEHFASEELVDVTLSCEGKYIRAHKLILSASSQYFKEIFKVHEAHNPIIIMMNIRFEYLRYIIDYVYKGEIKILSSEIEGILKLANDLQIKGLYGILNKKYKSLSDKKVEISTTKIENSLSKNNHNEKMNLLSSEPVLPKKTISHNTVTDEDQKVNSQKNLLPEKRRSNKLNTKNTGRFIPLKKRKIQKHNLEANASSLAQEKSISQPSEVPESYLQEPEIIIKEEVDKMPTADEEISNIKIGKTTVESETKPIMKQISAFMLFTEEYRPKVSLDHPDENFKQISLRLSLMWKNLPSEKKDVFYEAASRENEKLKRSKQK